MSIDSLLGKIAELILNPLIVFGFLVALMYFFFGIFQFVLNSDSEEAHDTGKEAIKWGLIGMFVMVSVFGIIHIILNTFGIPIASGTYLSKFLGP